MKKKHFSSKDGTSMTMGILFGTVSAMIVTILLAMILAALILNEQISENIMQYFTFTITLIAVLIGGLIAGKSTRTKSALSAGLAALVYGLILIGAGILFFDGGFHGLWTSIVAIAIGYAGSCALCISGKGRLPRRKRYTR